ncbi:MAG: BMP family ABC transporter substrate-binding protein [Candidatus Cryosericum sp.]
MRFLKVSLVVLLAIMFAVGSTGCKTATTTPPATKKLKVAFVYVGPHNDGGYSQAHEDGRLYLQQNDPNVETQYSESVPEGSQAEKTFRDYASAGYDLIFGTSFGFMDAMVNTAKDNPTVKFEHASGYKRLDNLGTYFGRMEQPDYLSGIIAGKMTKTNKIGFVLPYSIAECIREVDSFTVGLREVNPKATVTVIYTNSWFDPAKEGDAAKSLLNQNCDIIASGVDSPAPLDAAFAAGKYGIGYDMDMAAGMKTPEEAKSVLTSRIWHWGPYYLKVAKSVEDGTWKSTNYWGGMSDGIVDIAPISSVVPQDVVDYVNARKQLILDGKYTPFDGPMVNQKGETVVPAGTTMSDADQLNLQWFVQGVIGEIPKSGS